MLGEKKGLHTKSFSHAERPIASKPSKILQKMLASSISPYLKCILFPLPSVILRHKQWFTSLTVQWIHCLCMNITHCLLHVNGLLTMYGVMRPWVQGQPWYMRVKIGLYCTDDLISIFRDLGMEMTLFTFKCFVLAPGLLYLCLIPVRRQKCTESDWELASWIATIHCKHSKVYTLQPPGRVHKERAFDSFQESPSSFSFQPTWCMHSRK